MKKETFNKAKQIMDKINGLTQLSGRYSADPSNVTISAVQTGKNFLISEGYTALECVPGLREKISNRLRECCELIQRDIDNGIAALENDLCTLQDQPE